MNNKGLVVSTVLYTILIALLLFIGVTLANFNSSAKIIFGAGKDLVNGTKFQAKQTYEIYNPESFVDYDSTSKKSNIFNKYIDDEGNIVGPKCGKDYQSYQKLEKNDTGFVADTNNNGNIDTLTSSTIVRIYSRYGTFYWPRDFNIDDSDDSNNIVVAFPAIVDENIINITSEKSSIKGKLSVTFAPLNSEAYKEDGYIISSLSGYGTTHYGALIFEDNATNEKTHVILRNVCQEIK